MCFEISLSTGEIVIDLLMVFLKCDEIARNTHPGGKEYKNEFWISVWIPCKLGLSSSIQQVWNLFSHLSELHLLRTERTPKIYCNTLAWCINNLKNILDTRSSSSFLRICGEVTSLLQFQEILFKNIILGEMAIQNSMSVISLHHTTCINAEYKIFPKFHS